MAERTYSDELKGTLRDCPEIKFVHFTEKGDHYFSIHKDDSGNGKNYGRTEIKHEQSTKAGSTPVAVSKRIGVPSTEIVDSVKREIVLGEKPAKANP